MKPAPKPLFIVAIVLSVLAFGLDIHRIAAQPPQQSSTMYLPDRIRDDFVAAAGQTTFQSNGPVRSNYIEVYRNGVLQRSGATWDYVGAPVTGAYRVTFNTAPNAGEPVTLFYYR